MIYLYITLIAILLIIIFSYFAGKQARENEIIKDNNKITAKQDKIVKKTKKEIIEVLKKGTFLLMFFIWGCKGVISTKCPKMIIYSKEFQNNLAIALEEENNFFILEIVSDYEKLRRQLEICEIK